MAAESTTSRRYFVGGNWKCNGTHEKLTPLIEALNASPAIRAHTDVVLAPSTIHLGFAGSKLRGDFNLMLQNIWTPTDGAYTGETSLTMLSDYRVNWVLVGHSERRNVFGETSELAGEKARFCLNAGLTVVFCIGETLEEREAGSTLDVCVSQLKPLVEGMPEGGWDRVVIAYEPVWAIGTGKTASPEQAQETHAEIRGWLSANVSEAVASSVRIAYGGSVKAANAAGLIAQPDIDGFLVGGASLKPEFADIIAAVPDARL